MNFKKVINSVGIRTHASEETGTLNQRLKPLGHDTVYTFLTLLFGIHMAFSLLGEKIKAKTFASDHSTRPRYRIYPTRLFRIHLVFPSLGKKYTVITLP